MNITFSYLNDRKKRNDLFLLPGNKEVNVALLTHLANTDNLEASIFCNTEAEVPAAIALLTQRALPYIKKGIVARRDGVSKAGNAYTMVTCAIPGVGAIGMDDF